MTLHRELALTRHQLQGVLACYQEVIVDPAEDLEAFQQHLAMTTPHTRSWVLQLTTTILAWEQALTRFYGADNDSKESVYVES